MSPTTASDAAATPAAAPTGPIAFGEDGFHYPVKVVPVTTTLETKDQAGNVIDTKTYEYDAHVLDTDNKLVTDGEADADGNAVYRAATADDTPHNDRHGENVVAVEAGGGE